MIGIMWIANIIIGIIDFIIFVAITIILSRNYRSTKGKVIMNLLLFSIFMVIYALTTVITSVYLSTRYGYGVSTPLLIINVVSVIGFLLLYNVIRS